MQPGAGVTTAVSCTPWALMPAAGCTSVIHACSSVAALSLSAVLLCAVLLSFWESFTYECFNYIRASITSACASSYVKGKQVLRVECHVAGRRREFDKAVGTFRGRGLLTA